MRRTILLLDEEVDLLSLMRVYFRRKDFEVFCACTLADVYSLLQKEKVDFLLSSESFCTNWHEVKKKLETISPGTKVVITSGHNDLQQFEQLFRTL